MTTAATEGIPIDLPIEEGDTEAIADPAPELRVVVRMWHLVVVFATVAAAAVLTSDPGVWIADARLEFSTDPSGFLSGHGHLWDPTRGMGNPTTWYSPVLATFQAILQQLGAQPWLIERMVHAALLTLAATGVAALLRVTTPRVGALHLVAGLLYAFNPYTSQYLVPSGLFLSYAIAPLLLACFLHGIREREDDWRMAAGFALCVFAHGALNSAALLYALAPIPIAAAFVVFAERSIQLRLVLAWLLRAAILSALVASGALFVLWFQRGDIGLNLATTEQQSVVSSRSSWGETWRGLGLWLTYFGDSSGQLRPQSAAYFQNPLVVIATYAAPLAAGVTLTLSRWRPRWFFAALVAVGTIVMVGVWPPSAPSPFGRALNWGFEHFVILRGLRTSYKAGSVAWLGIATLAAYGVLRMIRTRAGGRFGRIGPAIAGWSLAALLAVAAFPFWTGNVYSSDDGFDEIPAYWTDAIDWLNSQPEDGRVMVLPGVIRTRYRWGYVNDNLFHGLLDKSLVMHQSVPPPGTPLTADVVLNLDRYLAAPDYREGTVGPILRRLGVRWVVFQNDTEWERIGLPRPEHFGALRADPDLALAESFGDAGENTAVEGDSAAALLGENALHPVEIYEVDGARDTLRVSADQPVVVAGAGDAWAQLAQHGQLDRGPVIYTGTATPDELAAALADGSPVVITDGSRRRFLQVAGGIISYSHTLALDEDTPRAARSPFEETDSTSYAVYADAVAIEASITGSGATPFDAAQRPALAFDRVGHTAWEVSGPDAQGAVLSARLREATAVDGLIVHTRAQDNDRWIRRIDVELVTGAGEVVAATVEGARSNRGLLVVDVRADDVVELRLRLDDLDGTGRGAVGIAEVEITSGGEPLDLREFIQTPLDLERAASDPGLAARLTAADISYSFLRRTGTGARSEETEIRRRFWAPADALLNATGSVQLTASTPDVTVDRLLAAPVGAFGSDRAPGAVDGWGVYAVDGDPTTSWLGPPAAGATLTARPPARTIESVEFVVTLAEDVAGSPQEFSFIEAGTITATGSDEPIVVRLEAGPRACDLRADGLRACTASISTPLPADVYETITLEITAITPVPSAFGTRPVAVSEVVFDGEPVEPDDLVADIDGCFDAFSIDGAPGSVRMRATRAALLDRRVVAFESCAPIELERGDHDFVSAPSWSGAVSELLLSAPGDDPGDSPGDEPPAAVVVIERSPTRIVLDVTAPAGALLIGPGAHHNGWRATVDGVPLGKAVPRDSLSAWQVPRLETTRVELLFRPQRAYELALALSAAGVAICLTLLVRGRRSS